MRILCLDVGTKRIGTALSDELGIAAHPHNVIERRVLEHDLERIMELCKTYAVERIVVGLPLDQDGKEGKSARSVIDFVDMLRKALANAAMDIDIETWDERYSTVEAEERLIAADVSRRKRKRVIDKMAAANILQSYMENN